MFTQVVRKARAAGSPSMPSTMKLELMVNPFLRPDSPAIRRAIGLEKADDVAVFAEVRRRKDSF
jgi:hydroxyacylglutathione hydrolase